MVRERLRGMTERTWWHHAVAAGPELLFAVLTLGLMPYFFVVGLPSTAAHPLDRVPFPTVLLIAVLGFAGAVAWLYGWAMEKRRGVAEALKWDRFGASLLTLAWTAGAGAIWWGGSGLPWTNGLFALALAGTFLLRQQATRLLGRRAVEAEVLVQRADQLLSETGEHPVIHRPGTDNVER